MIIRLHKCFIHIINYLSYAFNFSLMYSRFQWCTSSERETVISSDEDCNEPLIKKKKQEPLKRNVQQEGKIDSLSKSIYKSV